MNRLKVYLDTSVINFLFADDAPEKKRATIEYFKDYVRTGIYEHCISKVVIDEILRTQNKIQKTRLLRATSNYHFSILPLKPMDEIQLLASHYIKSGIIPRNKVDDSLHIAVTTIHKIDILMSWNYKHLANVNKERKIMVANLELGYSFTPRFSTPLEVFND